MIGQTISHYKILEKLGEGGMGVVYKAEDTKLKRTVALKFLPPELTRDAEAKERFIREARAASALDHPNICTIYEINEAEGQTFIAMAYIEGENLQKKIESGPLKIDEALNIAIHVAQGLVEAHERGIVHRDIKPANVMLTPRGQVKIMDFGLAKLGGASQTSQIDTILGTVVYMSPEQAQGGEVDHRTDIWSLGVVLYEMVAGRLPFRGEYEQAVMYSILNEEPEKLSAFWPEVPAKFEQVVNKTLAKRVEERYQSVKDILMDLRQVRKELPSLLTKPQPSIAVLPFSNLSADKEQDYFCEGMADDIISALAHVEGLRVVARTSAFSFRDKEIDIREIGRKLKVQTLLEGSVRKAGNRLRISAQLVNVADGYHLWSEKYDRDIGELCCPEDIFDIQDEISLAIVDKLKLKLFGGKKAAVMKHHTGNLEAYNLYLKGRYFYNMRTGKGLKKAVEYYQQAIEKDPSYALAYAGMGASYSDLPYYSSMSPKETHPMAKKAALKALELDNALAEAHASLGLIKGDYDWDWVGAEREFKRSIELNPADATARSWYSFLLITMARCEEAIEEMRQAHELDPLSLVINRNFGLALYFASQYDEAIGALQRTMEMDPRYMFVHGFLGLVYLQRSRNKKALAEFQREKGLRKSTPAVVDAWIGIAYQRMGKETEAKHVLERLTTKTQRSYVSPYYLAALCFALREIDLGFEWLEKSFEEHDVWLRFLKIDPFYHVQFSGVRSDSRFAALLQKMGLEK